MPQLSLIGNNIYSVDMMHAYNDIFKPKYKTMNIDDLNYDLSGNVWSEDDKDISPNDVLNNPSEYPENKKRVEEANLKYPIIISGGIIFDGFHRLLKSLLLSKKTIRVIEYDKDILKKFLLSTNGDMFKNYECSYMIKLFYDRFIKK